MRCGLPVIRRGKFYYIFLIYTRRLIATVKVLWYLIISYIWFFKYETQFSTLFWPTKSLWQDIHLLVDFRKYTQLFKQNRMKFVDIRKKRKLWIIEGICFDSNRNLSRIKSLKQKTYNRKSFFFFFFIHANWSFIFLYDNLLILSTEKKDTTSSITPPKMYEKNCRNYFQ